MATLWPQQPLWPTLSREHATRLNAYLHEVLKCINRTKSQPVPADLVKIIIHSALTLILKFQNTPNLSTICDALYILQTETKATSENTAEILNAVKTELHNTIENIRTLGTSVQQNTNTGEETRAAAKEAVEVGKANLEMTRQIKSTGIQTGGAVSYAAMAARGATLAGIPNTQVPRMPLVQTQREVIVTIRDPNTVQSLQAMNPRNLNAHVERAIAQSGNNNIARIKVLSLNQLKSGDLSIKTATSKEVEALKQFANNWVHRISNRATIRITTYRVLILLDNKLFILQAEIKYIGWLTRNAHTKAASSVIIEFSKPEDANKIINKGLIWQGECLTRKEEKAKAKAAYDMQPHYHPVAETLGRNVAQDTSAATAQRNRTNLATQRGRKRTNTGNTVDLTEQENMPSQTTQSSSSQQPQRNITLTCRALKAIGHITQPTQGGSNHHMEINSNSEA
ncbi:uncharacterized protein M421DRAFT_388533 [Didymella exigua CBS 183.55]|uniref:Uncharacterized protein n=1 Tax=Didymella exigua CBS 183.55 TaxID=1150837 RepID=A0A6A5S454_9PLEO|nr:uncharacterized protein M421DRAFT_388533 [Didymella exigua CBS 183.55]KAF1934128.1 hypothetical protein M421DRAFT_388533 [Didymella exigua CBS 183.55]